MEYGNWHHQEAELVTNELASARTRETKFTYTFSNHFHPFVGELIEQLSKKSIEGLLDADYHKGLETPFFDELYEPDPDDSRKVEVQSFPKKIDVGNGAYAVYNWELFFHAPLTIAVHLSKNQRFAEAQRWFHYIFDPTNNDRDIDPPKRFWKFLRFRQDRDILQIDELLRLLSLPADEATGDELDVKERILSGYEELRKKPFQPHAVARTRHLAYQYCVVMKYLDNLIAWGDSLFRQDTIETINEATQLYVLAANIFGPKPQRVPQRGTVKPKTFAQLRASGLDELGNALEELEAEFPFNLYSPKTEGTGTDQTGQLFGIGRTLYFCLPRNEKLLGYWDTVADRLFKIRHCMSIEGVVRQLPLFQPPIDPGMLVKAATAGIDVSSLVSGLNRPLAPVRSALLIQKALEICGEVRGLGASLLSALEKRDSEALMLLRQQHEINIQQLVQDVRFLQWKEAEEATASLLKSRETALERYRHYQRLLGEENEIPELNLERQELTEDNFDEVHAALVERYDREIELAEYPKLEIQGESEPSIQSGSEGQGSLYLNTNEDADLNVHMPEAQEQQKAAMIWDGISQVLRLIYDFSVNGQPAGVGVTVSVGGGSTLSTIAGIVALKDRADAAKETYEGTRASKTAAYERRADDWILQNNLAARELMQIGQQIISSLIREQIARHEYENVKVQIEQAQETDQFLRDKFTNEELYGWMQGELSKLYYEYYKFAFDIARKAEQTMKHELMRPELDDRSFIKFNYWDGGRKGLLSGEALHLDIKRMEMAYHDHNKREYEMTKHISLRQLDPVALLALKATGSCEVTLPEWLFDLDTPGHYMRRIKNVSLSIPAVTGPYTSVNCTLSLLKSTLRRSPELRDDEYQRASDEEDTRFVDYYGTIQSIVTSNAQNDSGMFEANLRDERFLPFEGAGAMSTWKLELPAEFRQFDYNSISDVILHMRYMAREGGSRLRQGAVEHLHELVKEANTSGLIQLFSLKHDFPSEWHRFVTTQEDFVVTIKKEYFPYFVQGEDTIINKIEMYAIQNDELVATAPDDLDIGNLSDSLNSEGKFELTLAEDAAWERENDARAFLVFRYSIS